MHSSIFTGRVSHSRKKPLSHTFSYGVFMMYLDLAELDKVFSGRWFWSARRCALARFRRENHFGDPAQPLDECVRELVQQKTGERPKGAIRLLTNLSYFGYCFNPISLYYCFDHTDTTVEAVVAEVSNTPWGECCCYVLAENRNREGSGTLSFRTAKKMHVSPFIDMDVEYDWALTEPADNLFVRINNISDDTKFFFATLALRRKEINGMSLATVLLRYPLMTITVMFSIHWQAFRLWIKGCPVQTHPEKKKSIGVTS
ncbi:MAG: chromosome partitioning protein ParA [Woeseia sp.]|nr:chromosome partitioning protein ParA [Woeseia sp.]|tara:strand:- start:1141 stop:1914 length:774 start_codon:yes stop_codon:yes gene_type:complete